MRPRDRIQLRRDAANYQHALIDFRRELESLSLALDEIDTGVYDLVEGSGGGDALRALQAHDRLCRVASALHARAEALAKAELPLRLAAFFGRDGAPEDVALFEAGKLVAEFTGHWWPEGTIPSMQALHEALTHLDAVGADVAVMELLPELDRILFPRLEGELVRIEGDR